MIKSVQGQTKVVATPLGGKEVFTVAIIGNYFPEAANIIRGPLSAKLISIKRMVLGKRADRLELVMQSVPSSLTSLADRVCKTLNIPTRVQQFETEDSYNNIDLVIRVKLKPSSNGKESLLESISNQYESSIDPWLGNDKFYELTVTFSDKLVMHKKPAELLTTKLPALKETSPLNYTNFDSKISEFNEKELQEVEPTHDREDIPAYGEGVLPNTNMAGGLGQT